MAKHITPRRVFGQLVNEAIARAIFTEERTKIRLRRKKGQALRDDQMPGYLIKKLKPDERAALADLTPEMTDDRVEYVMP